MTHSAKKTFVSSVRKTSTVCAVVGTSLLSIASVSAQAAGEVNIYSARSEALIAPLLDTFSKEYDVKVNLVTGSADALLSRLQSEGTASPADLFISVDAGRLYRAKDAGYFSRLKTKN